MPHPQTSYEEHQLIQFSSSKNYFELADLLFEQKNDSLMVVLTSHISTADPLLPPSEPRTIMSSTSVVRGDDVRERYLLTPALSIEQGRHLLAFASMAINELLSVAAAVSKRGG